MFEHLRVLTLEFDEIGTIGNIEHDAGEFSAFLRECLNRGVQIEIRPTKGSPVTHTLELIDNKLQAVQLP